MMMEHADAVDVRDRVIDTLEWIHGHSDEEFLDISLRVRLRQLMDGVRPEDLTFSQLAMITAMVGGAHCRMLDRAGRLPSPLEEKFRPIGGSVGAVALRAQRLNRWLETHKTDHQMRDAVRDQLAWLMDQISPEELSAPEVTTIVAILGPVHGRLMLAAGGRRPAGGPSLRLLPLSDQGAST